MHQFKPDKPAKAPKIEGLPTPPPFAALVAFTALATLIFPFTHFRFISSTIQSLISKQPKFHVKRYTTTIRCSHIF